MDEIDRGIMQKLSVDGRASLATLGSAVNLAPSSVKRRVERLESSGVIRGYTVLLNSKAVGQTLEAVTEVFAVPGSQRQPLVEALTEQPEVVRAWSVAGEADVLAIVRVRDTEHLEQLILRLQETDMVARTRTQVLLTELLNRGG